MHSHRPTSPKTRLAKRNSVARSANSFTATPIQHFTAPHVVNITAPGSQSPSKSSRLPPNEDVSVWAATAERFLMPVEGAQEALNMQFEVLIYYMRLCSPFQILRRIKLLLPIPNGVPEPQVELILAGIMQICNQQSVIASLALVILAECLSTCMVTTSYYPYKHSALCESSCISCTTGYY